MATKAELIEFLNQFPDDTEIEILETEYNGYSTSGRYESLDLREYSTHFSFYDFRNDNLNKSTNYKNKTVLTLGSEL